MYSLSAVFVLPHVDISRDWMHPRRNGKETHVKCININSILLMLNTNLSGRGFYSLFIQLYEKTISF